jgi:alpha-ketoglutarate-dependent dioxygenase FTO
MSSNWEKLKNKSKTKSTTTQKQKFRPNVLSKQKTNDKKSRKRLREEISQVSIPSNDSSSNKKRKKKKKKKKHNSSSSTSSSLSSTANTATSNELSRTLTKAPNPFRVSRSNTYLQPNDSQFHQVSRQSYRGLVFDTPAALPSSLHQRVASALESMRQSELFHRDVVATGRSVSATFVERTLVGNPGMTYYYQRLRIFAFPWDDAHCLPNSPLLIIRELNDTLKKSTKYHLKKDKTPIKGSCDFNISLINYMQSQNAANKSKVPLKKEGIFGLGDASVSWHADSSLKNFSSIAVYHQTGDSQGTSWSVASRVIGDDVTPAIKVPLKDRQT